MEKPPKPEPQSSKPGQDLQTTESSELDDLEGLLENMEPEQRELYRRVVTQAQFSGPLPLPALFKQYDEILPGAAERIMSMTEREQAHRHTWETNALDSEINYGRLGLKLGAIALFLDILGVVACAYFEQPVAAGALGLVGLTGIVSTFVKGRDFNHSETDGSKNKD